MCIKILEYGGKLNSFLFSRSKDRFKQFFYGFTGSTGPYGLYGPALRDLTGYGLYGPTGLTGRLRDYRPYGTTGPTGPEGPYSNLNHDRGSWKPYLHAGLFSFIRHAFRSPRHILEGTSHCQPGSGQMGRKNRNYPISCLDECCEEIMAHTRTAWAVQTCAYDGKRHWIPQKRRPHVDAWQRLNFFASLPFGTTVQPPCHDCFWACNGT